ncbi:MAG: diacylglycerol kinase family lipid kinase [Myxococcales bacterium]|nr:diacylglycerol kinase family lipid kinase [Myxococcales bacterium]
MNPRSAGGRTGLLWRRVGPTLSAILGPFDARLTERPWHAAEIARDALDRGYELIVSVGGDGTNFEVLNGWFDEGGRAIRPEATLAVLPCGTGGDFRRTLDLPGDPLSAARAVAESEGRRIDVGRLRYTRHDGGAGVRHFLNVADAGYGGQTVRDVNRRSKRLGGRISFLHGGIATALAYRNKRARWRVDAGPWREGPAFNLIAANARFHGAGVEIAPDARIDDGLLDFVLMGDLSKREIARTYAGVFAGKGARGPKVETARGRRLEVEGDEPMLLDVDGEQIGRTPAVFEVVPGALLVRGWI